MLATNTLKPACHGAARSSSVGLRGGSRRKRRPMAVHAAGELRSRRKLGCREGWNLRGLWFLAGGFVIPKQNDRE